MIEFDKDCAWDNFMTPNYTDPAMPFPLPPSDNATMLSVKGTTRLPDEKSVLRTAVTLRRWRAPRQQATS